MKRFTLLIGMLVLSLLLVACGGAAGSVVDSASEAAASQSESSAEENMEEAEEAGEEMEEKSIVDIAVEDGRFTTLVTAVGAAMILPVDSAAPSAMHHGQMFSGSAMQ